MLKAEFEFVLEDKIDYAVGGNTKTAQTIVLKAPCYNDTKQVLKLHGLINQGMRDLISSLPAPSEKASKQDDDNDDSGITPDFIVTALMSGECKTDEILDIFTSLLIKSARLDGEAVLTSLHLDQLSPQTVLKLLGEYVVNFPLAV